MYDISYTQNRELSMLKFNERVLDEANDNDVPLMERLKFISIFDSNTDEFFMVRVGSLTDLTNLKEEVIDNKSMMNAQEQIDAIMVEMNRLYQKKDLIYEEVRNNLMTLGYSSPDIEELSEQELERIDHYFNKTIVPQLTFQVIDLVHPFPHLPNLSVSVFFHLKSKKNGQDYMGLIQLPEKVNRYYKLNELRTVRLEKIIEAKGAEIFNKYEIKDSYIISVTRNADVDPNDEDYELDEDYRSHMAKMIKKRKRLQPVRLEINKEPSKIVRNFLLKNLELDKNRLFITRSPMRCGFLFDLLEDLPQDIVAKYSEPPFSPQPSTMVDINYSIIEQVKDHDVLLSYPYESMDPIVKLLEEAANDEEVVSIKITLYRIAKDSEVAKQLIAAAENGKDVVVLMELRARFDEENNITWSSRLEKAGCRVIYGFNHYKCHSKVMLITRLTPTGVEYITQIATGNYNEKTAKQYTDFSFITADEIIALDAVDLFDNFLTGELNGQYRKLMVSPKSMQKGLGKLFDEQIELAKKGGDAYIRLKMNSISDRGIIEKIAEASNAGVKIDMMVRGICCIIPGIEGKTENLDIYSVVGRFLEHHRIYQFGRGLEAKLYISSADFMTRNIRRRVEVACPIEDPIVKWRVYDFLDTMFADDVKIRKLLRSGHYTKVERVNNFVAQEYLMKEAKVMANYKYNRKKKDKGLKLPEASHDEPTFVKKTAIKLLKKLIQ